MTGAGIALKRGFCAGAGPNVSLTLTGIKPGDEIISVLELQGTTTSSGDTVAADRTSTTTIFAQNTIRCSVTTAGRQLEVLYWSK
jgi:hypothetical protein